MSGEADTPAPFSSDQVAALGRGKLAEDEVAAVLDSHPSATAGGAAAAGAAGQAAPLELSASDLEALARGETPPELAGRLAEASAAAARAAPPAAEGETERPSLTPPGA